MKVIYDISVLGYGFGDKRDRTGLFRVVENVALGLASSLECELSFSSIQNAEGAIKYLAMTPHLALVPFPDPRISTRRVIDRFLFPINTKIYNATGIRRLLMRLQRKMLFHLAELLEPFSQPVHPNDLRRADIFHSPFARIPQQVRAAKHIKRFLTVYDLTPIFFPQFFEFVRKEFFVDILQSLGKEDWAICDSQSTKHDLCDYLGIAPMQVFVAYPAADPRSFYPCHDPDQIASVRKKYNIPDAPYLLSLSALEPRKNLEHVIRAFARLIQEQHIPNLSLVLAGPTVRLYEKIFVTVEAFPKIKDRIILTGYIEEQDLAPLYSGAVAFVYMSLYEGFGLPPLEAMQCGAPVITSNNSSLPEVIGDAGIMLSPTDSDGLCQSLWAVYRDSFLREQLSRNSLARAKQFSWEKCVQQTIAGYKTALAG